MFFGFLGIFVGTTLNKQCVVGKYIGGLTHLDILDRAHRWRTDWAHFSIEGDNSDLGIWKEQIFDKCFLCPKFIALLGRALSRNESVFPGPRFPIFHFSFWDFEILGCFRNTANRKSDKKWQNSSEKNDRFWFYCRKRSSFLDFHGFLTELEIR